MSKNSKDDGQFFMVFVGGKQECDDNSHEFANVLMGAVAIAIVLMVFLGLINDAEKNRAESMPRPVSTLTRP